jgi:hypothetical protein
VPDIERVAILIVIASIVFLAVLTFITRRRSSKPTPARLFILTVVVVLCGMLFGRYGHILFRLPWWIYYGLPVSMTFLMPPLVLRMNRAEIGLYVPMAVLMAPTIHVWCGALRLQTSCGYL